MKIGIFDKNMPSDMDVPRKLAEEQGVHIQYIDKLSYLSPDDEFKLDVLLIIPTLNLRQWQMYIDCIKKNPQIKFIFYMTIETSWELEASGVENLSNVESYLWHEDHLKRFHQLLAEAKKEGGVNES